ncbi:glycerophosphodiester phosphodiesterase family protein [Prescottella subtropica]|uniref:glycerophosphodiester phosphodiesterase family protein n=1 Tax=Prescottella subtropica TaxID=2545757 RepID=UPI0010F62512|nr:glycerophosphodiester phosphodiesterase family protein [Prescottella subtropica]
MSHSRRSPVRAAAAAVAAVAALGIAAAPASASPLADLFGSLGAGSLDAGSLGVGSSTDPGANLPAGFDLQAHRGGLGETIEESLPAFRKAIELGVTTLELDIVMSKDGVPVVWHDATISSKKCSDTAPATANDPQFPYVGDAIHDLTWAQLQTLDCDKKQAGHPDAETVKGNKLIQLRDVFTLAAAHKADVHFNIETKIEAARPETTATPQEYVDAILREVRAADAVDKVMIQSFDWSSLPLVRAAEPSIPLVMLWDEPKWLAGSPWTGPVDYDAVGGDIFAAAKQLGADVMSPSHTLVDEDLIKGAHDAGRRVVPWTVDDATRMNELIDVGVDGIITNYPTRLRAVMADRGMDLPQGYPAP